jgi:hypothetical protein
MARAQRGFPRQGLRHRIEHCAICPPDLRTSPESRSSTSVTWACDDDGRR